jgi:hypothetical protein
MAELQVLDMTVVSSIKKLMDNIRNDIDAGTSMDDLADIVYDHKLMKKTPYKNLLKSVCDLLREKGYPTTADFFSSLWHL